MTSFRRTSRGRFWRGAAVLLGVFFAIDFIRLSWNGSHQPGKNVISIPTPAPSIYVASIFWNSAAILHSNWNDAVLELAEKLGAEKIYISIYESGSWDDSKHVLRQLESVLVTRNIRHRIILDETTHQDDITRLPAAEGWVRTPRGRTELRRIPYLSKLRNKTLEPLVELAVNGTTFDKVLFLNDVAFEVVVPFLIIAIQETLSWEPRSRTFGPCWLQTMDTMLLHVLWTSRNRPVSMTLSR